MHVIQWCSCCASTHDRFTENTQRLAAESTTHVPPCRLLHDISKVDRALGFWAARLKAGQHRSFLLLGQGPTSFLLDILAVVTRKADRRNHLSATDQIERRVCFSNLPPCTSLYSSWGCLILA